MFELYHAVVIICGLSLVTHDHMVLRYLAFIPLFYKHLLNQHTNKC